jgi:heptosyltransferase-2
MKNVAVFMPSWIEEFVLALSVVSRKAKVSDEELTLIVPQHLIPLCTLLTPLPYFPYRRTGRGEILETIDGIKRQGFDKLYLLSNSFSAAWFGVRTGIPVRRGMQGDLLSSLLTQTVASKDVAGAMHITREYSEVLEVPFDEPQTWSGVTIRKTAEFNNIVALCPGPGHRAAGGWQGFREIVKLLPSYDFVVLGSENDAAVAKSVASHLPHRVHDRAGKTTMEAAAAIIANASVVIANHCGLMHLAGFLGTPVVGIFGSTSAVRYRPLGAMVRCAVADASCVNCGRKTCERKDNRCFQSILPEQVLALAGEIVRQAS